MKISSQLANNFDYCSAEGLFKMISFIYELLRDLSASALKLWLIRPLAGPRCNLRALLHIKA